MTALMTGTNWPSARAKELNNSKGNNANIPNIASNLIFGKSWYFENKSGI